MGDYNDALMRGKDAAVQARTKAQNRATVLQLKLIGQSHPTGLTTNLLKLFEPRPPLEYRAPYEKRKCPPYSGIAQFVGEFAKPGDPEYTPPVVKGETLVQKRARIHKQRLENGALKASEELQKYDPSNDSNVSGDPYKTLFVARLSYETTEHRIKREFEAYGPIKRVRLITDKSTNKPRGYGFIEYMHTRDMKTAYKQADGRKIDNRRVIVDVERGRTVPNWRPRRLGGGLGFTRIGGEELNQKHFGRESQQISTGGAGQSEDPRVREDREMSRGNGREREQGREKSRERSHERARDRDVREDRHNRDRDRNRDRERGRDRGRDRSHRGRDHNRDHEREHDRDHEREHDRDHERERHGDRDLDYEYGELDRDFVRPREMKNDYGQPAVPKHGHDRFGSVQPAEKSDVSNDHGRERYAHIERGHADERYGHDLDNERPEQGEFGQDEREWSLDRDSKYDHDERPE